MKLAHIEVELAPLSPRWLAILALALGVSRLGHAEDATLTIPNAGFETIDGTHGVPEGWDANVAGGAKGSVAADAQVFHSGARAVRIANGSPAQAFVFVSIGRSAITVCPSTTYNLYFFAKGRNAHKCYAGVGFGDNGDERLYLPKGDYEWRRFRCQFTTPETCVSVSLHFAAADITDALWIDDVSLERAPTQYTNLPERRHPKDGEGAYPRTPGPVAEHLVVFDASDVNDETELALAALQGIVNRRQARIYLINRTNPRYYDESWLAYMKEKGYTGREERVATMKALIGRFRSELVGAIVYDPELPGSVNAATMLAGLKNALPLSPAMASDFDLPVVMDLRGLWKRNVEAYRYVYEHYWERMSKQLIAWTYPLNSCRYARDYMVEFNVFCFWLSNWSDDENGADPEAEEDFVNELLANTPGNVAVMGWPMYGDDKGIPEYTFVRRLSEYGKFVPGFEFCSNLSVHTAIHPPDTVFKQRFRETPSEIKLENDKTYISVSVMDSGDALWYWQLWQRKLWSDPVRGASPTGWCVQVGLYDTLPLIAQWFYEHMTPNDCFFSGISGLGYMSVPVYAGRFHKTDRERIWKEFVRLTDDYCRKMDIDGLELYNGSWGETPPRSPDTFRRFTQGMENLDYIVADLGRHDTITPANANSLLGDTAVFHTLSRYQVWTKSAETQRDDMDNCNTWLLNEIESHSPGATPGFMSTMAISWYYYPSWLHNLQKRLPSNYVMVLPNDLARLYRESCRQVVKAAAHQLR